MGALGKPAVEPIKKVVLGSTVQTNIELSKDQVNGVFPDGADPKQAN
jgi:hypothetical protein